MKVWFVQGAAKDFFGGGEAFAVRLASWLRMQGHQVEFVARPQSLLAASARSVWLNVHELALRNDFDWLSRHTLSRWLKKDPPDVLFGAYPRDLKLAGRVARRLGARVIWLRGIPMTLASKSHRRLDSEVIHHYVVPSEYLKAQLVGEGGFKASKVTVVFPGMDITPFEEDPGAADLSDQFLRALQVTPSTRIAVCLSRLDRVKGHSTLIEAWALVCAIEPDVVLVLAGDGSLAAELKDQATRLGIADRIRFVGHLKDVRPALWNASLMITPSISEMLGIALLESMAAGVPNIASHVGGIPEVIEHGVNGLLVPPENPAALSDQIIHLLRDQSLQQRLSRAGRLRAKDFTSSICFPPILTLMGHDLSKPGGRT